MKPTLAVSLTFAIVAACGGGASSDPSDTVAPDAAGQDALLADSGALVDAADGQTPIDSGIAVNDTATMSDSRSGDSAMSDSAGPDSSEPDTGPVDVAVADTGASDAAATDTAPADTGASEADTGTADTGASDTTPPDTGASDTTPSDSGAADTTPSDTGPADTSPSDTGLADTTPSDTGAADTTPSDTGPADTNPSDTGPADTTPSDTGPADTGPADTGPADTGADDTVAPEPDPEPVARSWSSTAYGSTVSGAQSPVRGLRAVAGELWLTDYQNGLWERRNNRWWSWQASQYQLREDVCGARDDLWVSGGAGGVVHWDGVAWSVPLVTHNSRVGLHCDGPRVTAIPIGGDVTWHFDGSGWARVTTGVSQPYAFAGRWNDLWGLVGTRGDRLVHFDGAAWAPGGDETAGDWRVIAALDDGTLCAAGEDSAILCRPAGGDWSAVVGPEGALRLDEVAGTAVDDLWVATSSDGRLFHWDGEAWEEHVNVPAYALLMIDGVLYRGGADGHVFQREGTGWRSLSRTRRSWLSRSSSGALYRSGGRAGLDRFDGVAWIAMDQPFRWDRVGAILAIADDDIWLAGEVAEPQPGVSTVHHWDGQAWTAWTVPTPRGVTGRALDGFWARASDDVYAWNGQGDVLRWSGTAWQSLNHLVTVEPVFVTGDADGVWTAGPLQDEHFTTFAFDVLSGSAPWSSVPGEVSRAKAMVMTGTVGWLTTEVGRVWRLSEGAWTEILDAATYGEGAITAGSATDVSVHFDESLHWNGASWVSRDPSVRVETLVGGGDAVHGITGRGAHVRWDGSGWRHRPESLPYNLVGATAAAVTEAGVTYIAGAGQILRDDGNVTTLETGERIDYVTDLFTLDDDAWALGRGLEEGSDAPMMWRRVDGAWRRISGPPTGSLLYHFVSGQAVAPDDVWVSNERGVNNLWRYHGGAWTQVILGEPDTWFRMAPMIGGRIMALAHERNVTPEECQLWHHDGGDWGLIVTVPVDVRCDAETAVWAAKTTDVWLLDAQGDLAHFDGAGWRVFPRTISNASGLIGPRAEELYTRLSGGVKRWNPQLGVWESTPHPPGVLGGRPYGDMVIVGSEVVTTYRPE